MAGPSSWPPLRRAGAVVQSTPAVVTWKHDQRMERYQDDAFPVGGIPEGEVTHAACLQIVPRSPNGEAPRPPGLVAAWMAIGRDQPRRGDDVEAPRRERRHPDPVAKRSLALYDAVSTPSHFGDPPARRGDRRWIRHASACWPTPAG